ncbi:MAG TPA: hypothetical protein VGR32_02200 [Brevundimonas sp.]|jgi:hypothetical protein|uniref:hypothetical protein n=1 Tax=Brevundimonas sp. TaxID=1871086 RepID=UPI002DE25B8C|nr:hypothetical protein [Brevundimonas sp.]
MLTEPEADAARDAADDALLAALDARLTLGAATPDVEALALRRLLARAPERAAAIKALWGRLERGPLHVHGAEAALLAADRHGLGFAMHDTADKAMAAAESGGSALIGLSGATAWWGRLLARPNLRVVGALPDDVNRAPRALRVSTAAPGPTGDDRTFWVTDAGQGDAAILAALSGNGLAGTPLHQAGGLKLFMLAGYVQAEDPRLTGLPGTLSGVVGAAPVF